ncbi:hypothetical protein [Streptomyces sp. NPDC052535]|uniref:hypothetical protein n=1 Tax=Streptomyces sp. NPDC052535 TaxID=3155531 RepID=UPI00342BCD4A
MTAYALPLLLTAAAGVLTYLFCVRPMLKGRGCHMMFQQPRAGQASCHTAADARQAAQNSTDGASTDAEIARLREEIQLLHHELDLRSGDDAVQLKKEEPR